MSAEAERVMIHTDGSCLGNPGPGGYAAIMMRGDARRVVRGHHRDTTNNRMELMGPIKALQSMKSDAPVTIYSDSQYLIKGITKWLPGWKLNGWKVSNGKLVANRELWEELDALVSRRPHGVNWQWIKGHADSLYNEEADRIATVEARLALKTEAARHLIL